MPPKPPTSNPNSSELTVNIQNYGGVPDNFTDNTRAFIAAYKALKGKMGANENRRIGKIFFPGGGKNYQIGRPLVVQDPYIQIVGDQGQSEIRNGGRGPTVIVGLRDIDGPTRLTEAHWPKISGKLDGEFSGHGFRTVGGDSTVVFAHCPLTEGIPSDDQSEGLGCWGNIKNLTFEIAMEKGDGTGGFDGSDQYGIFMFGGYDSPPIFSMSKGGVAGQFDFKITDSYGHSGLISISTVPKPGVVKIALQIDLDHKKVLAFVDGVQVDVSYRGAAFAIPGSRSFRLNERDAMIFGVDSQTSDGRAPVQSPNLITTDIAVYGLSFTAKNLYIPGGIGTPQQRIDRVACTDYNRFGSYDAFARLWGEHPALEPLDPLHDPENPYTCRLVSMFNSTTYRIFYGYFFQNAMHTVSGGQAGNAIKDLIISQDDERLGATVAYGPVLDLKISGCRVESGSDAVVQIPSLASYLIEITDCELSAANTCVFGAWSIISVRNTKFRNSGRWPFMTWASNIDSDGCFLAFVNPQCRAFVTARAGQYGMLSSHRRARIDAEGQPFQIAAFDMEQAAGLTTTALFEDIDLQGGSVGKPVAFLRSAINPTSEAVASLRFINASSGNYKCVAFLDGTGWEIFEASVIPGGRPDILYPDFQGQ